MSVDTLSVAGKDLRTEEMTRLKTRLLALGLRAPQHTEHGPRGAKPALRVRSGSCGGLDLILPDGTWVNAPVLESFAHRSPLELVTDGVHSRIVDSGTNRIDVQLVREPAYYSATTSSGRSMRSVGQLCSDRIGVGLTNICTFFRSREKRCQFCSIGHNVSREMADKAHADVIESVGAALQDPVVPARHVLLGGGTPDGDDRGAERIATTAAALKQQSDTPIYAMLAPPADLGWLEVLAEAGVDEIGMNIEVFSASVARRYIPGKHAAIPLGRYWTALERAVQVFGPVNTRSITVVGLEPAENTIEGVRQLAAIGVLPILSPLRLLDGTPLQDHGLLNPDWLWELTLAAAEAAGEFDMPLGPTCIACQSNVLTMPGHPSYRHY